MLYYLPLEIVLMDIFEIFFTIFDVHTNYTKLTWTQNLNALSRIVTLKMKARETTNLQLRDSHSSPLFKSIFKSLFKSFIQNNTLKSEDNIRRESMLLISKSFNNLLPPMYNSWFRLCSNIHNYQTVSSCSGKIFKKSHRTDSYAK